MRRALTYRHTIRASELGYITQSVVNNLAPLLFLIFQQQFAIPLSRITLLEGGGLAPPGWGNAGGRFK